MKIKLNDKNICKIKFKITYTERNQAASFDQQNARINTPGRATLQAKIQVNDLYSYLKVHPHRRPPHTSLVKSNHPVSPQMEHWNGLKCVNVTYTGNIIWAWLAMTVYWLPFSNIVF